MASIVLDRVCVDFPIYDSDRSLRKLLFRGAVGGIVSSDGSRRHRVTIRGLDNLSFELHAGDRVGLIGHNGAGKSTLLRIMSGAYRPSSGTIAVDGRVSPLLSLGIGFNVDDTGFENLYTAGLYLGMTPRQIRAKTDEIAKFTELGEYLRVPVRTYSNGMKMRLGFAIATAMEPEILLIDEVLGVGDTQFMLKAAQRIKDLMSRASLLVLASHSPDLIRQHCDKAMLLQAGRIAEFGKAESTLATYEKWVAAS